MLTMPYYMDVDPGVDDALALVVAKSHVEVKGVTAVAGNVELPKTFRNACKIMDLIDAPNIPVVAGSAEPLLASMHTAVDVHGDDGLGGYEREVDELGSRPTASVPGWVWLAAELEAAKSPSGIIASGPLTNIARLCLGFPHVLSQVRGLTIMGGSLSGGNVTSTAEFNFYADPDAAEVVLGRVSGIRLVGLDVTHQVLLSWDDLRRFRQFGQVGDALFRMLSSYAGHLRDLGYGDGIAIHDVLAVAAAHQPDFFMWEWMPLTVVRDGTLRGTLVAAPNAGDRSAVAVATGIRHDVFFSWFWEALEKYR